MQDAIRKFLNENYNLISEKMEYAAKESFSVSESGGIEGTISVVLTTEFDLETIRHPHAYDFSENVLYVLNSFECETYIVDYDDVVNFLTSEQAVTFEKDLLANAVTLLRLENDKLDEFLELSKEDQLRQVIDHLYENYLILDYLESYDKELYEDYLKRIYDEMDTDASVDLAMERMFDNLYVFE